MFGRTAIWLVVTVALVTLSMAVPQELPEGEGKKLVEERCAGCHSLQPVVSLKRSRNAWKELVVKNGGLRSYELYVSEFTRRKRLTGHPVKKDYLGLV